MIIYKCRITGDEMISDAYKLRPVVDDETKEEVPELFECESMIVLKSGKEIDVGCGNAFGGAGEDEGTDDSEEKVNNIIDESIGFGYNEMPMGKKDLKDYLKVYCGEIRKKLKDDSSVEGPAVKAFTQAAPDMCKYLLKKFDDLQFFMSPSFNPDGALAFSYYAEGSAVPTFMYVKAGLVGEKC